jgi:hypothetical protein
VPSVSPGTRFGWFFLVAAVAGALGNIVGGLVVPPSSQPVRFHSSGELVDLVVGEQIHVTETYGLYAQLREIAEGDTITIPRRRVLSEHVMTYLSLLEVETSDDLRTVAGLERLTAADYRNALRFDAKFEGVIQTRVRGATLPYLVASVADDPTEWFLMLARDEGLVVVADRAALALLGAP